MSEQPPREYIDFEVVADTGKTKVVAVINRGGGYRLGVIKWYGSWRQYTFHPAPNTVWNVGCLRSVESFIEGLMAEWKNARDDARKASA
jgi:hypothetical protein